MSVLCVSATPGLFRILTTTQLSNSKCPCLLCPAFAQWTWLSVFLALDAEETAVNRTGQVCPGGACTLKGGPRHTWSMSGAISLQREGKGCCPSCVGKGGHCNFKDRAQGKPCIWHFNQAPLYARHRADHCIGNSKQKAVIATLRKLRVLSFSAHLESSLRLPCWSSYWASNPSMTFQGLEEQILVPGQVSSLQSLSHLHSRLASVAAFSPRAR